MAASLIFRSHGLPADGRDAIPEAKRAACFQVWNRRETDRITFARWL
jgi:hypothetical protein